jgi:hypothetical protein
VDIEIYLNFLYMHYLLEPVILFSPLFQVAIASRVFAL